MRCKHTGSPDVFKHVRKCGDIRDHCTSAWHASPRGIPVEQEERSRAISFIFSGLHVGSLAGLLVAPPLIEHFGWEVVFYIFGVTGVCRLAPALPFDPAERD